MLDLRLRTVGELGDAIPAGAVIAAVDIAAGLEPVTKHTRSARLARRRQCLYRALETVEHVGVSFHDDLKSLVIVIAAGFTSWHSTLPPSDSRLAWLCATISKSVATQHGRGVYRSIVPVRLIFF
jgi:hypothetical protein